MDLLPTAPTQNSSLLDNHTNQHVPDPIECMSTQVLPPPPPAAEKSGAQDGEEFDYWVPWGRRAESQCDTDAPTPEPVFLVILLKYFSL